MTRTSERMLLPWVAGSQEMRNVMDVLLDMLEGVLMEGSEKEEEGD